MANNETSLQRLKSFLNQLFQFESQDLDFGIYKILHYKKDEIKQFIDDLLVTKVRDQLQLLSDSETQVHKQQLAELETSPEIARWLEAVSKHDQQRLDIYTEDYKDEIKNYKELKAKSNQAEVSAETENMIYNHLIQFFSRYYDKGDFISKRRFGKNEKYVVPYNGEEIHFHWANQDQYYIKSSETFQRYAFKLGKYKDALTVFFKLTEAQMEQGNVKVDEANYFILSEKAPEVSKTAAVFYFEYRPLTEAEKSQLKANNKQDSLDEQSYTRLKKQLAKQPTLADLWQAAPGTKGEKEAPPLLLKKLHHYTRKNKYDFFIHKNLKGFLERELDYYIKSELINVDDLYVSEAESHFQQLKHKLKSIKVFKEIADTIIDFVSQLEEFQKRLWEKKKFVLNTEWVITVDRLIEYVGEKAARPILLEVIKNKKQIAEWQELFGRANIPAGKLSVDKLKDDLLSWRNLPIDTVHYDAEFKARLLSLLSQKIKLEEQADGLVMHSDNFQGLNCVTDKLKSKILTTYLDPPYNTGDDGFIYKDSFQSSTWASMFKPLLEKNKELLLDEGSLFVSLCGVRPIRFIWIK